MNNRDIEWKKWVDPFHIDKDENENENEDYPGSYHLDEDEEEEELGKNKKYNQPGILGPWGFIPITELNRPGKAFNFWEGNTNFPLTYGIKEIIENVTGVETLDIFSPLRMRVAIGHCFDEDEIKERIKQAVREKVTKGSKFVQVLEGLKASLKRLR